MYIILILLLIESFIIYAFIKIIKTFLGEIKSIKGLQFGSINNGDPAPLFRSLDHRDIRIILKDILKNHEVTLLFLSNSCPTCKELLDKIETIDDRYNRFTIVVSHDEILLNDSVKNLLNISFIKAPHLFSSYKVTKTPYVFMINKAGIVTVSTSINNYNHLNRLIINEEKFMQNM
ncbi:TlpA family protein disulfide reductase [Cytobacillus firmus]|uniref:TlpA family protein disulfide reductase n=1 Tax=Cytobacillus firmus TaxID=1399 RepID=UPI001A7EEFF5|nr:conjugal transfer protein TraF [Cytobacillus firmus]